MQKKKKLFGIEVLDQILTSKRKFVNITELRQKELKKKMFKLLKVIVNAQS